MPGVSARKPRAEGIGARLRHLRKSKGFTQVELAQATGSSQPMIAHYETRDGIPGPHVVIKLAEALGVSPEEILGLQKGRHSKDMESPNNLRLWRKLKQTEKLAPAERRSVVRYIEALVERDALKRGHQA